MTFPKNPKLFNFRCSGCKLNVVNLTSTPRSSWLTLHGYEAKPRFFCKAKCMFLYIGRDSIGLEQMSKAIEKIINDKYFRKTGISKKVSIDSLKGNKGF